MQDVQWRSVQVPANLISATGLPPVAKILYIMLLRHSDPGTGLCQLSTDELLQYCQVGSHHTLRRYIGVLASSGWLAVVRGKGRSRSEYKTKSPDDQRGPLISLPDSLFALPQLTPVAKWLYCYMRDHCYRRPGQAVSQARLRQCAGLVDDRSIRTAIRQLCQAGWLFIRRRRGAGGSVYEPLDPHLALREAERDRIHMHLQSSWPRGEALLKEMLNVLVDDPHYEDNARPGFLTNPVTGEKLELDRAYVQAKVGIEFNGPQHYTTTLRFNDPAKVLQQRQRDLTKAALASEHGVALVRITATQLTFAHLHRRLTGLLPLRPLSFEDPVVNLLDRFSRNYASKARRGQL